MKTKHIFKHERIPVDLKPGIAIIEVDYEGPSKEIVKRNNSKFVDVFPTIKNIIWMDSIEYDEAGYIVFPYRKMFLIINKINEIVKDFKRIKVDDYLEIVDAYEMVLPTLREEENKNTELLSPAESKYVKKVLEFKEKLFHSFKEKESEFSEKDRNMIYRGFNVIDEILFSITKKNK